MPFAIVNIVYTSVTDIINRFRWSGSIFKRGHNLKPWTEFYLVKKKMCKFYRHPGINVYIMISEIQEMEPESVSGSISNVERLRHPKYVNVWLSWRAARYEIMYRGTDIITWSCVSASKQGRAVLITLMKTMMKYLNNNLI